MSKANTVLSGLLNIYRRDVDLCFLREGTASRCLYNVCWGVYDDRSNQGYNKMNTHKLNIWPEHYNNVKNGTKTFEIRKNDRAFQKGDIVELFYWPRDAGNEHSIGEFTYDSTPVLKFRIGDVYPISSESVVFSLLKLQENCENG